MTEERPIPDDPEGMNDKRAGWAGEAVAVYAAAAGLPQSDNVKLAAAFLADLHHWADRNNRSWGGEYAFAMRDYHAEIGMEPGQVKRVEHAEVGFFPADPDDLNDRRAEYAGVSIRALQAAAGEDADERELVFRDLLSNLNHWLDRRGVHYLDVFQIAMSRYAVQTAIDVPGQLNAADYLDARGFVLVGTGGGCTALERVVPGDGGNAWQIRVTAAGEGSGDLDGETEVDVGVYELRKYGAEFEQREEPEFLQMMVPLAELTEVIGEAVRYAASNGQAQRRSYRP
ncbi:hypothetical protein ACTOWA_00265 [Herbaspirillum seropedicae]|uniref:hypothetical protein n=1 Tax=Herbaspirillum seropedicae TaxID=964 RepID=UPI00285ECAAC|nr:hypothetical protein [Herbaspirillum seropedicae]MDR6397977.1 hypothetical protein [Herbaspirillum seropedicae]